MTDSDEQGLIAAGWQRVRFENLRGGGELWEPPGGGELLSIEEALAVEIDLAARNGART